MRRFIPGIALSLALGVMGGAGAAVAQAQTDGATSFGSGTKDPSGAMTFSNLSCMIRTNEQPKHKDFVSGTGTAVVTPEDSLPVTTKVFGTVNFACHARVAPGTVTPFMQSGFTCHLDGFGTTTDSSVVWSSSGQGTLTCHKP